MTTTQKGDRVQIHYTGRFEDGQVFDSSEDRNPLEFTVGGPEIIPGVSLAVIGMEVGDKKTVSVPPEEGYGPRYPEQSQRVPRQFLPQEVQVGAALQLQGEDQEEPLVVWVTEIDEESAVLDANHPLAGQVLVFDIELVSVNP